MIKRYIKMYINLIFRFLAVYCATKSGLKTDTFARADPLYQEVISVIFSKLSTVLHSGGGAQCCIVGGAQCCIVRDGGGTVLHSEGWGGGHSAA